MRLEVIIMKHILLITILIAVLIPSAYAASWSGSVITNSDAWSIARESSNLSFSYEQKVAGRISPVDYRGRTLSPYHSLYQNLDLNDVRVKERTAALLGEYSSEELLKLDSSTVDSVNMTLNKASGSDLYDIEFFEHWPVRLSYNKSMTYMGKGINNRESVGNNKDYVAANFLYNQEFSKERAVKMSLDKLNASILATDEAINFGETKATRDTQYKIETHSTGVASFKWRQVDVDEAILNMGDERFVGAYDIVKNIRMKSRFDLNRNEDRWLPCCSGGWNNMNPSDKKSFAASAKSVFDCTCPTVKTP
jgi:hypothetical protein